VSLLEFILLIVRTRQINIRPTVDFIGSYTWYKRLETRGKVTLRGSAGKEVTVIPPVQYGERFRKAMDQYFLMVPGRCSCFTWLDSTSIFIDYFCFIDKWIKIPGQDAANSSGQSATKRLPPVL
jgi:hypothetical protein